MAFNVADAYSSLAVILLSFPAVTAAHPPPRIASSPTTTNDEATVTTTGSDLVHAHKIAPCIIAFSLCCAIEMAGLACILCIFFRTREKATAGSSGRDSGSGLLRTNGRVMQMAEIGELNYGTVLSRTTSNSSTMSVTSSISSINANSDTTIVEEGANCCTDYFDFLASLEENEDENENESSVGVKKGHAYVTPTLDTVMEDDE
ncbi:hypothetical protein B0H63DRAFT_445083 [Podospora didyma]|uniref:Membrane-associated protein n=1 Tax=Podospora didyma TaxID=330526 RepID=A0AAE0P812_9PEZI|nr:hypothetical protein B0H63DRAFT_445083 [Podospora didyma]